jgi:hypothetical protein
MESDLQGCLLEGTEMIWKASCSILLLASAVMAQSLLPGTLASSLAPDTEAAASSESSAAATSGSDARQPITAKGRVQWVVSGTIGPEGLAAGVFSAGWDTLFNSPKVYGTHWEGFGKRLGMSVAGNAVSDTMEAGLGAAWGEDPRYFRDGGGSFGHRLGHAAKMTFMAEDRNGNVMPAYARYMAIPGSNFLSNTWRAPGDDGADHAIVRTGLGFLGRFGDNTFAEFWPDVKRKLFHRGGDQAHN